MTKEQFNENAVLELRKKIDLSFKMFISESEKPTVKAQARRARKHSSEICKLMKEYRQISIK